MTSERLFYFLEYFASHVYQFDFAISIGREEIFYTLGNEQNITADFTCIADVEVRIKLFGKTVE